jgi:hypothetical protein
MVMEDERSVQQKIRRRITATREVLGKIEDREEMNSELFTFAVLN